MALPLYTNNASATLAVAVTASDTTLTLATGKGVLFPTPSGGDYFWLTLSNSVGLEIVQVTSRSGDVLTVVRGQQSTGAMSFSVGDTAELRMTAGGLTTNVNAAAASAAAALASQVSATNSAASAAASQALIAPHYTDMTNVLANSTNINTVAGIAGNVTTVANISADVTSVATNVAGVNTVAAANSNIATVAGNIANVNAVAGNNANITTVAGANSNIGTVVSNISNVNSVGGNIANVNTVAGASTAINTVSTNITNVNTVGTNAANVVLVGGSISNVNSVSSSLTPIGTVATNIANVNSVGGSIGNVNTVAGMNSNISSVISNAANINATAAAITNINTVGTNIAGVNTAATNMGAITTVNSNSTNINTVATNINTIIAAPTYASTAVTASNASLAMYGSLSAVQTAASNAQTSANSASASATSATASASTATNASNLAVTAWSAATAPNETLATVDKTFFTSAAIVDIKAYDTRKDSDGGAWRKKCTGTSWYNETVYGKWLGEWSSEAYARTLGNSTYGSELVTNQANYGVQAPYTNTVTPTGNQSFTTGASGTTGCRVYYNLATVIGKTYKLEFILDAGTQPGTVVFVTSASNGVSVVSQLTTGMSFTATTTNYSILFANVTVGAVINASGISVKEVTAQNATTNDYFYNTTAAQFQALNATSGVTQVYRGNKREFPENCIITAESNRVVIWDLTDSSVPMWMVFKVGTGNLLNEAAAGRTVGAVFAINGDLFVGLVNGSNNGLSKLSFIKDTGFEYYFTGLRIYSSNIALRNSAYISLSTNTAITILAGYVNSVAATVLPNAPIDPATGLPVPTIAVGTAGGVSVIKDDGTVVNITCSNASFSNCGFVEFIPSENGRFIYALDGAAGQNYGRYIRTSDIPSGNVSITVAVKAPSPEYYAVAAAGGVSASALMGLASTVKYAKDAFGYAGGLSKRKRNPVNDAASCVVDITTTYNSGWMNGDIRGAWLADTVAGAVGATDPDRSVKNNPLTVVGTLNKSPVATGSQLVAYSGFSAGNYLEQPYSANLDFGTGTWAFMVQGVFVATAVTEVIFCRDSATTGVLIRLQIDVTTSVLSLTAFDGTTTRTATGTVAVDDGNLKTIVCTYSAGTLTIYVNGSLYATATGAALLTLNNATGLFRVGIDCQAANPLSATSKVALIRASATAPSADQIAYIYETERKMFEPGAQVTLAGTSAAVTCLDYDDVTGLLHVGTSYGRSTFKGLVRTESEATTNGAPKAYASYDGTLIQAGATGSKVYIPSKAIRDELNRAAEQKKSFGQELISQDFTATTGQTAFVLPLGFVPKFTYQQGLLKKQATGAGFWTSSYDGFRYTVTLGTGAVGAPNPDVVSILCTRSNV